MMKVRLTSDGINQGLIAILDALGASSYSENEIQRFLDSRRVLLSLIKEKADDVLPKSLFADRLKVFTFNDTIVIVYRTAEPPDLDDVEACAC